MSRAQVLAVALLVVLAGCGGSVQDTATTVSSTTTATTGTTPAATTATTTATTATPTTTTTTRTPTTTPAPDNPWEADIVTVAVDDSLNQSRDIGPLVNETLAYWNDHAEAYGDYAVEFQYTTDALRADIVVELVTEIPECGSERENRTVGCAPVLETGTDAGAQETVEIVAGYTDDTTRRILKHEFGHVLGIEHGEEPMPTMRSWTNTTYLEKPDAENRTNPWGKETLSVYVDGQNWTRLEQRHARDQIEHALTYYEEGADGHGPENVSFVQTSNRTAADIVITWPDSLWCTGRAQDSYSCGSRQGFDTDTDPALEEFTKLYVAIGQIDHEAIGWHVGYWLAVSFGLTDEDELPPPFVDPDYETTHGEWWE